MLSTNVSAIRSQFSFPLENSLSSFAHSDTHEKQSSNRDAISKPKQYLPYKLPPEVWSKIPGYLVGNYLNYCQNQKTNFFQTFKLPKLESHFLKNNPRAVHEIIHNIQGNLDKLSLSSQAELKQIGNTITQLNLRGIPLTTSMVTNFITYFPNLTTLIISASDLTNKEIVKIFSNYPQLNELIIHRAPLVSTAAFTESMMCQLAQLPHLRKLDLVDHSIITDGAWQKLLMMTKLTSLKIPAYSMIDTTMEQISHLHNLTLLHFGDCIDVTYRGFQHLEELIQLRELHITGPQVFPLDNGKLSSICRLKNLTTLKIPSGKVSSLDFTSFNHLKDLTTLAINIDACTYHTSTKLASLTFIKTIELYYNLVSTYCLFEPQYLANLQQLTRLHVELTNSPENITWENLAYLQLAHENLSLSISINFVAMASDWQYLSHLKQLQELKISNCRLHQELQLLNILSHLKTMTLERCDLTVQAWQDLSAFQSIKTLTLISCIVNDNTLQYLASLTSLEILKITNVLFNGDGFCYLTALQELKILDITDSRLNDQKLSTLIELRKRLPSLQALQPLTFHIDTHWELFVQSLHLFIEGFMEILAVITTIILVEMLAITILILIIDLLTKCEIIYSLIESSKNVLNATRAIFIKN